VAWLALPVTQGERGGDEVQTNSCLASREAARRTQGGGIPQRMLRGRYCFSMVQGSLSTARTAGTAVAINAAVRSRPTAASSATGSADGAAESATGSTHGTSTARAVLRSVRTRAPVSAHPPTIRATNGRCTTPGQGRRLRAAELHRRRVFRSRICAPPSSRKRREPVNAH